MTDSHHAPHGALVRCTASSLAGDEPLIGTAVDGVRVWLLVQLEAAWGKKGLEDTPLPPGVLAHIQAAAGPGVRPQLIKVANHDHSDTRSAVFVVRAGDYVERLMLADLADLIRVDLAAWIDGDSPEGAEVIPGPMVLVCAHTKRDACCAEFGLPLYRALEEQLGHVVWQSSHLGGHRFAATLVTLPDGHQYGRLNETDADSVASAVRNGTIGELSTLRGCTRFSPPEQAVDAAVRKVLGLTGLDDIRILSVSPGSDDDVSKIVVLAGGRVVTTRVRTRRGVRPIINSCGATEPSFATSYDVFELELPP